MTRVSRRWAIGAGLATVASVAGCGSTDGTDPVPGSSTLPTTTTPPATTPSPATSPAPRPVPDLPRGGTTVLPTHRLVGYCGYPGSPALGRLGTGDRVAELERRGRDYAAGRTVLPVLELIATIVQGSPGADGTWRRRAADRIVDRYLDAARDHRALLLLNIQPGRSDFLTECRHFEDWLREPDVGVALDPEWAMQPGQTPGRAYGRTTGAELDEVAAYLSGLTVDHRLPEKVLVFHQVAASVVRQESELRGHDGVVIIKSVDGLGAGGAKVNTYRRLTADLADAVHPGFKLFFDEDTQGSSRLMTPDEVLDLAPRPDYVMYE